MTNTTTQQNARLADKAFDNYINGNIRDAKHYAKRPSFRFLLNHFAQFVELHAAKEIAETLKGD